LRLLVCAVALASALGACGDDGPPDEPVALPDVRACGDAYLWAGSADGSIAVVARVDARDRSSTEDTTITFTVPDPEVEVVVERGTDMGRNVCTDSIDGRSEPTSSDAAVAGEGTITLGPTDPEGFDSCGTRGSLRLTGVEADDGTRFAPVDADVTTVGCYSG
jgi:hypothetical protein